MAPQASDAEPAPDGRRRVELGRIGAPHGVRGWVRVISDTDPPENILRYRPWLVGDKAVRVAEGRRHGKTLIARLEGCEARDDAEALTGRPIAVYRDQLPPPRADEFYWVDLQGLGVQTLAGDDLGQVSRLFPTGANDVLVVQGERERLLPFIWDQVIKEVDFDRRRILVDWDPAF